jgi:hypothetical protein
MNEVPPVLPKMLFAPFADLELLTECGSQASP